MKKMLFALATIFSVAMYAQEKPLITEAVLALDKRGDLPDAKKRIDEAGAIIDGKGGAGVDSKQMSKYLYYKGLIHYRISISEKPAVTALAPDALDIAATAWLALLDFEKQTAKPIYTDDVVAQLPYLAQNIVIRAYDKNEKQDYAGAKDDFLKAYDLKKNPAMGKNVSTDTSLIYNAAIISAIAGDTESAIDLSKLVLDLGYNGITYTATNAASGQPMAFLKKSDMDKQVELKIATDPKIGKSVRPDIYKSLLASYKKMGNPDGFKATLAAARTEYPSDVDLINYELQEYLDAKDFAKALEIINVAIEKDPNNAVYYYVKGFIYQESMNDGDKALEAYGKALEIDPNNFDCNYMSGAVYYARGKSKIDEMGKLGMTAAEQKKYDKLKVEKVEDFKKALPYFEKAHQLNAEDAETVKALWETYRQVGNAEKSVEMKKLLDTMTTK